MTTCPRCSELERDRDRWRDEAIEERDAAQRVGIDRDRAREALREACSFIGRCLGCQLTADRLAEQGGVAKGAEE